MEHYCKNQKVDCVVLNDKTKEKGKEKHNNIRLLSIEVLS